MNDLLRIARLRIALQRAFLGRAILRVIFVNVVMLTNRRDLIETKRKKIDPKVPNRPFCLATKGSLTKSGVLWQIMDFGAKIRIFWPKETFTSRSKQCSNHNEKKFQKSPGVLVICPFDEKARFQNKKLTYGPKYQNFGVKIALFSP